MRYLYRDEWLTVLDKPAGFPMRALRVPFSYRLDRGCSGPLLLVEGCPAEVRYLAVVRGFVDDAKLDQELDGQPATTHVRALDRFCLPFVVGKYTTARYSLIELRQSSHARHQIRRHLRDFGHPLVGDIRYGDSVHNRWLKQVLGWKRLGLSAVEVSFRHPVTDALLSVPSPPPVDLLSMAERMRFLHS